MICDTLSGIWKLEVLCDCITKQCHICTRECLHQTYRALGMGLTMRQVVGLAVSNPAALKTDLS